MSEYAFGVGDESPSVDRAGNGIFGDLLYTWEKATQIQLMKANAGGQLNTTPPPPPPAQPTGTAQAVDNTVLALGALLVLGLLLRRR